MTELEKQRAPQRWMGWLAPAFLIFTLLAFFIAPGTTLDKFYMVCFGI